MKKTKYALIVLIATGMFIGAGHNTFAQDKFITKNGHAFFYSEAPLENIEAHNNEVLSIIDLSNNAVVVDMLMKSFSFEKSLMQEHFNENYIESDKFPKASFKGSFTSSEPINPEKDEIYEVEVTGELTIHGITKSLTTKGTIEVKDKQIFVLAKFPVAVKDYDIKIPKIVVDNIAEVVEVTIDLKYNPFSS